MTRGAERDSHFAKMVEVKNGEVLGWGCWREEQPRHQHALPSTLTEGVSPAAASAPRASLLLLLSLLALANGLLLPSV